MSATLIIIIIIGGAYYYHSFLQGLNKNVSRFFPTSDFNLGVLIMQKTVFADMMRMMRKAQ